MKGFTLVCAAALAFTSNICCAQELAFHSNTNVVSAPDYATSATASPTGGVALVKQGLNTPPPESKLGRWVKVDDLNFSFRYRNETDGTDFRPFDNGQQKSLAVADFKLDSQAKYSVHLRVSSGRTFNWSYADEIADDFSKRTSSLANILSLSPAQIASVVPAIQADPAGVAEGNLIFSRGWEMSFRELYFRAAPVTQVAVEFGSLGIEKGISTEATTYDDDGYVTGERIRIFDPKHLFFDQAAATFAYEGDLVVPSFFARGERLKQDNYRQLFVAKKIGRRFETSADYTFDKGTHTLHQAVFLKVPEVKAIDSVRLELYQRLNDHILSGATFYAHQGFALTGSKTFYKKFQLDGGAAHIDYNYGVLMGSRFLAASGFSTNGDAYLTGTRAFTRASYKAANGIMFFGYYTHIIADPPPASIIFTKQGITGGMTINLKQLVNTKRQVF